MEKQRRLEENEKEREEKKAFEKKEEKQVVTRPRNLQPKPRTGLSSHAHPYYKASSAVVAPSPGAQGSI